MDLYFLLYFFAGLLQDFLWTLNVRFIVKSRLVLAGSSSVLATLVTMVVLYSILTRIEDERSIIAIVIYALGVGAGTVFAMKLKLKKLQ